MTKTSICGENVLLVMIKGIYLGLFFFNYVELREMSN